jgi:DNA repair exonuclease SbcCD ATPase subunit
MANEPFDDMPKITLEKDDLESFQRTRAQANTKNIGKTVSTDDVQVKAKGPSWFMFLFILAALAGGGAYWSAQQYKVMQQAQARITELENRLSATGEEMDQSTVALGVKVKELSAKTKELWEQMDKLWASAWRRNQSEIKTLTKSVNTLKANNKKAIDNLASANSANDTEIGLAKEQLVNQASMIKQLQSQLTQVSSGEAEVEQQLTSLREKLISTALANNNLINRIEDLEAKVKAAKPLVNTPAAAPSSSALP